MAASTAPETTAPEPTTAAPEATPTDRRKPVTRKTPRYNVVLWDDSDHSYQYVIGMMASLFGQPKEAGFAIAREVDTKGKAIVLTTTLEHAELKRDQVHAFGPDAMIASCKGSMSCTIERVD